MLTLPAALVALDGHATHLPPLRYWPAAHDERQSVSLVEPILVWRLPVGQPVQTLPFVYKLFSQARHCATDVAPSAVPFTKSAVRSYPPPFDASLQS